jgi:hypothetical protein
VRIGEREFTLSKAIVVSAALGETPRRINAYFVDIAGRRFPPKQLLRAAIGAEAQFDSAFAVRVLEKLGFDVIRVSSHET